MLNASTVFDFEEINPAVAVALSGGVDSVVLLHLCCEAYKNKQINSVRAIHIHHDLSPHADKWASFCKQICGQWGIPFHVQKVYLSDTQLHGVEAAARKARYKALIAYIQPNEYLLQGHHQNDQAETVLFRALRGSGPDGLAAISNKRSLGKGTLLRPLLSVSRKAIEDYARKHHLLWIDDESNNDTRFDRNFLRHKVIPLFQTRWPRVIKTLSAVAQQCYASQTLLDEVAVQDMQNISRILVIPLLGKKIALHGPSLSELSKEHQLNLVKYWLRQHGVSIPSKASLNNLISEVVKAKPDRQPVINCHGVFIYRYGDYLLINDQGWISPIRPKFIDMSVGTVVLATEDYSTLTITHSKKPWGLKNNLTNISVMSRSHLQSTVAFSLPRREGKKSLKKWLNEYKVPSWLRDKLPILVQGNNVVGVPGLFNNVIYSSPTTCGLEVAWSISNKENV